ncbi:MAG: methionine--tRNA ligase [Deltaproteobacteria bacterium]|nr:methionine--tRNA ligase [Deltaproteobacteria bacterium]
MKKRLLVTSALPYANGPIHLGHLVEYIQTDVYVRFRRALGHEVAYVCAADSHGTPIEVNASKAGMAPGAFAEKWRTEQAEDFRRFSVDFDVFYTTDSPENQKWSWRVYRALKQKGLIYAREVEQLYCEKDARFLPDRFVKGTCPKCGTPDQYGDVCEKCGTTYDPRELAAPRCVLCGTPPVVRASKHAYVNLRESNVFGVVQEWVRAEGHLEPAVRAQVQGWLDDLQDWCITRDAPYFGFPVPPEETEYAGKYLYVWVDAPIGYLASAENFFATQRGLSPEAFEKSWLAEGADAELQHFIGKDILRFHSVFWPAMLWSAGVKRADRLAVHGHLTVNGEKMSKSRGTFVTGKTYLESGLDPELLRYFYAANLGPGIYDIDLSLEEFRNRINADLANNIANLASRVATLLQRAGGPVTRAPDEEIRRTTLAMLQHSRAAYEALQYRDVVRNANQIADLCNKRVQAAKPWENPLGDAEQALLWNAAKALVGIAQLLQPVMPRFAAGLVAAFGATLPAWDGFDPFSGPVEIKGKPPQIARLDARQVARLIVTPPADEPQKVAKALSPAETASKASAKPAPPPPPPGVIGYDDFARVELKVARILAAQAVPKADKLLQLSVDVGEPAPRTIVAGIAQSYPDPAALVGRRIVVVANLEPRPLRGILSQGMLLAAGESPNLQLVSVGEGIAPGTRVK